MNEADMLCVFEKGFKIRRRIDIGALGGVFSVRNKEKKKVVLKQIDKKASRFDPDKIEKEIRAGKMLHHENIVMFFDSFESDNSVFLVLEYIRGHNLYDVLEKRKFVPLEETVVKKIMIQIVEALIYCHSLGIVHRDIKVENIILTRRGVIKLIDFGFCEIVSKDKPVLLREFLGSKYYTAPEILASNIYDGFKIDVWSTGVVMYVLLFSEFPFFIEELVSETPSKIKWPDLIYPDTFAQISQSAKNLINQMLNFCPSERISMEKIPDNNWFFTI